MTPEQRAVFERIADHALASPTDTPYLIGINGKDAAGKTIFSDSFADYLKTQTNREVIRISIDDFMNPRAIQTTPARSLAESAYLYTFDMAAFKKYVLEPLAPGGNHIYKTKVFDEPSDQPAIASDEIAMPDAIFIIDGVLLFKRDMVDYFNLKIVLEVSDDTAMQRGIERDKRRGKKQSDHELQAYRSIYIACQAIYYREDSPLQRADMVIDNNDYRHPVFV